MKLIELLKECKNDKEKGIVLRQYITNETRKNKTPTSIYLEITPMCNLKCKMCYSRLEKETVARKGGLITADKWIDIARQSVDLGALYINITGGECLSHPQFKTIYREIYELGVKSMRTNKRNVYN